MLKTPLEIWIEIIFGIRERGRWKKIGGVQFFLFQISEMKKKISSNIKGLIFNSILNCSKAKKKHFKFIRLHSFCVRNLCCVNYLITIQIQSCIQFECCVHTSPNRSGFDLWSRIKLPPVGNLVQFIVTQNTRKNMFGMWVSCSLYVCKTRFSQL